MNYKFRGKEIDSGEWVYGSYLWYFDHRYIIPLGEELWRLSGPLSSIQEIGSYVLEVDPATVGMFTGLLDKNGKEIYEGSQLSFTVFDHNDMDTQHVGQVYWDEKDLAWNIQSKSEVFSLGYILRQDDEVEVIGDIHDNPELAGGKDAQRHT